MNAVTELQAMGIFPALHDGRLVLRRLEYLSGHMRQQGLSFAKEQKENIIKELRRKEYRASLASLPVPWTPATWNGRPCCYLPMPILERLRDILSPDLMGMGVPAEGLPGYLRGASRNGWRLCFTKSGRVAALKTHSMAEHGAGLQQYLELNMNAVADDLRRWKADGIEGAFVPDAAAWEARHTGKLLLCAGCAYWQDTARYFWRRGRCALSGRLRSCTMQCDQGHMEMIYIRRGASCA